MAGPISTTLSSACAGAMAAGALSASTVSHVASGFASVAAVDVFEAGASQGPERERWVAAQDATGRERDDGRAHRLRRGNSLGRRLAAALEELAGNAPRGGDVAQGLRVSAYLAFAARVLDDRKIAAECARTRHGILRDGTMLPCSVREILQDRAMIERLDRGIFDFTLRAELDGRQRAMSLNLLRRVREGAYQEALEQSRMLPLEERAIVLAALADEFASRKVEAGPMQKLASWFSMLAARLRRT